MKMNSHVLISSCAPEPDAAGQDVEENLLTGFA
jgi:hypothetical protein